MGILNLLKKSALSLGGLTQKVYNQQQAKLEKTFKTQSRLDLNGQTPEKYILQDHDKK
jgi:hypothetical protein